MKAALLKILRRLVLREKKYPVDYRKVNDKPYSPETTQAMKDYKPR